MEKKHYNVIVTTNGQQIPVEAGDGIVVRIMPDGDSVKETVELDVNEAEFKNIRKLALTNKIPADIFKARKVNK